MRDLLSPQTWLEEHVTGGKPWSSKGAVVVSCPWRADRHPSLVVWSSGNWFDRSTHEKGGLKDAAKRLGLPDPYRPEVDVPPVRRLTPEEKRAAEQALGEEEKAAEARKAEVVERSRRLWESARVVEAAFPDESTPPYLGKKGVRAHGARQVTGAEITAVGLSVPFLRPEDSYMLVPWSNAEGDLQAVQVIFPSPVPEVKGWPKMFPRGASCRGVMHAVDGDLSGDVPVLVAEGWATAATLRELSGALVVAAAMAGNVRSVVEALRKRFPSRPLVLALDADEAGRKAFEACKGIEGVSAAFPASGDWNDVFLAEGRKAAKEALLQAIKAGLADRKKEDEAPMAEKKPTGATPDKKALTLAVLESPDMSNAEPIEHVWNFPRGGLSVLAADPGSGKSALCLRMACELSRGVPILDGEREGPYRVLVINGEGGSRLMNSRLKGSGWQYDPLRFKTVHQDKAEAVDVRVDLDSAEGQANVETWVEAFRPDLVVVDSLIAFMSGDESDVTAMRSIGLFLRRIAQKNNAAVLLVTHVRKRKMAEVNNRMTQYEIQGSNALARLASVIVGIQRRQDPVSGEKRNDVLALKSWFRAFPEFSFVIPDDGPLAIHVDKAVPVYEAGRMTSSGIVEQAVYGTAGEPFTRQEIEQEARASKATVTRVLSAMVEEKILQKTGFGYATTYRLSSTQRESIERENESKHRSILAVQETEPSTHTFLGMSRSDGTSIQNAFDSGHESKRESTQTVGNEGEVDASTHHHPRESTRVEDGSEERRAIQEESPGVEELAGLMAKAGWMGR